MQYSFKVDDYDILENISNIDLCHISQIKLAPVWDIFEHDKVGCFEYISNAMIAESKIPCNLQTLLFVASIQEYIPKVFWPKGENYRIVFPGTKIFWSGVTEESSQFFGNFFPGIGMLFGRRLTCVENLHTGLPPLHGYAAYFDVQ